MSDRLKALSDAGVSIWLDDLSRERIETGNVEQLVDERSVVGVTTNPTIFAAALADGKRYDDQLAEVRESGGDVDEAIFALTTTDVRDACDKFTPVWEATGGVDGRVSIEVPPGMAFDTEATVHAAERLWAEIDRPNLLVKIPATTEGIPAITRAIGQGISVNVTLIFGLGRYDQVMDAYLAGLEQAKAAGRRLDAIHSVASFFVSRVDGEVDKRLDAAAGGDSGGAADLKGRAAVANARLAYRAFEQTFGGERFGALAEAGANPQRPLWASTGVKNPDYPDTLYVSDLVVSGTVNTMPEKTLEAFHDHGEVRGDQVTSRYEEAEQTMAALRDAGIDYDDVIAVLEQEGVDKFVASWDELVGTVRDQMGGSGGDSSGSGR